MTVRPVEHRSRPRRRLALTAGAAALIGVLGVVAMALGTDPADRTFAAFAGPTQSLMSIVVPFLGVLLVGQLTRPVRPAALLAAIGRALGLAGLVAAFGGLLSTGATLATSTNADPWQHAGVIATGSLLVQGLAALVGTGLGLLVRRPVLADLATIALPLGLWALLGAVPVLAPTQPWLTPYPSVTRLLAGGMDPTAWAQWLCVLLVWGIGLNGLGLLRARRSPGAGPV